MAHKDNVNIKNRKASYDYEFIDKYVAGIKLQGTEVKSIRDGRINISDAYCYFQDGELFIKNMSIQNMPHMEQHDTERPKKLLLNKSELDRLQSDLDQGKTIVVCSIFELRGKMKADIALAKGKRNYDKRQAIKKKDIERDLKREV